MRREVTSRGKNLKQNEVHRKKKFPQRPAKGWCSQPYALMQKLRSSRKWGFLKRVKKLAAHLNVDKGHATQKQNRTWHNIIERSDKGIVVSCWQFFWKLRNGFGLSTSTTRLGGIQINCAHRGRELKPVKNRSFYMNSKKWRSLFTIWNLRVNRIIGQKGNPIRYTTKEHMWIGSTYQVYKFPYFEIT